MAARPADEAAHAEAVGRAREAAAGSTIATSVAAATADVDAWVLEMFNRSTDQPGWMEANWGRPGTAEDRVNLAASLGEVVTALLLGDRLSEGDREELLGPWAALVETP